MLVVVFVMICCGSLVQSSQCIKEAIIPRLEDTVVTGLGKLLLYVSLKI